MWGQRTLTIGEVSLYDWPPVYFVGIQPAWLMLNEQQFYLLGQIQTSQTRGQPYSDTSPYGECSLVWLSMTSLAQQALTNSY